MQSFELEILLKWKIPRKTFETRSRVYRTCTKKARGRRFPAADTVVGMRSEPNRRSGPAERIAVVVDRRRRRRGRRFLLRSVDPCESHELQRYPTCSGERYGPVTPDGPEDPISGRGTSSNHNNNNNNTE